MINVKDSERLSYALMDESHADQLFELDQDPDVMRYINGGQLTTRDDIEQRLMPRMMSYRNPEKGWGIWQVTNKSTSEYLGWILVRPFLFFSEQPEWNNLELGWRFKKSSWGKGIATEAAKALYSRLVECEDVEKFCAIVDPDNAGSIGVMTKLGMSFIDRRIIRDPIGDFDVLYFEQTLARQKP